MFSFEKSQERPYVATLVGGDFLYGLMDCAPMVPSMACHVHNAPDFSPVAIRSPRNESAMAQTLTGGVAPASGQNQFRNSTRAPRGLRSVAQRF